MALAEDVREITEEGYAHPWLWALSTGILAGWEALYQREQEDLAEAIESLHDVDAEKDSANEVVLSADQQVQVADLVNKVMLFCEELAGVPLFPYQRELSYRMIESLIINDGEEITALWSRQSGKALAVDTPMLTPTGWTTMGALKVGDEVFGADGTPTKVVNTFGVFTDHQCYRVRFSDGQEIIADAEHLWQVDEAGPNRRVPGGRRTDTITSVKTTQELLDNFLPKTGRSYRYHIPVGAALHLPERELPIDPYLLGAWLGDGTSSQGSITTADWEVAQAFLELYEPGYIRAAGGKSITYNFLGLFAQLRALGLVSWPSRDLFGHKHIPSEYLTASEKQRLALLQGLMDTDGYCSASGAVEFCSTSSVLAADVLLLVRSLGWKATLREGRAVLNGEDCGPRYSVCWTPYAGENEPFRLDRKRANLKHRPSDGWRSRRTGSVAIVAIEPVATVPTKCITVDNDDHLYLAGSGLIPTHNTQSVSLTIAGCMVILPKLASIYPELLGKYERGLMVGVFAPVEDQAETLYGRVVDWLTSDRAIAIMLDPEIDDRPIAKGKLIKLKRNGSFCRMQTANPRAKIESKSYHLMVIDECFPAETPVLTTDGWVAIGDIVNGDRRDWVVATQEADGSLGWGRVTKTFKTPRHNELVRVDHEHGSVYATANHPFVVGGRRVAAKDLAPGTVLSVVPGAAQPARQEVQELRHARLYAEVPSGAAGPGGGYLGGPEPHEESSGAREDLRHDEAAWVPPQGAGREWSRADRATAEALGRSAGRVGRRACCRYWTAPQGRATVALQDRPGVASGEDRRGGRRGFALHAGPAGAGPAQGAVAIESRVVGVEVLQPGSPEFAQFSDGADYVYTLEVDSDSHTYVAGGVLVGNCQEADDYTISKSIHPMGAFYNATIVKTGTPARVKGNFYRAIQHNKRRQSRRGIRQNHFQFDWRYCNTPEAPIWMGDFSFKDLGDVRVGDEVIGWEWTPETNERKRKTRRLTRATVTEVFRRESPIVKVTLASGAVIRCTPDHWWLSGASLNGDHFINPEVGKKLVRIIEPTPPLDPALERDASWLGGVWDGEGTSFRIAQHRSKNPEVWERIKSVLSSLGIPFTAEESRFYMQGGRQTLVNFLNWTAPAKRRTETTSRDIIGRTKCVLGTDEIVAVEHDGYGEVISMTTTTGNYVAWGFASKNCAKYNPNYRKFVEKEKVRIGEDSDEFQLSYELKWLLDRGMFITESRFLDLSDKSMETVKSWWHSPVLVGIDPAKTIDSTVVTVVHVDWEHPDEFGYYHHRVLNWLELFGEDWEEQYFQIVDFLAAYDVFAIGVDGTGVGDVVADRLARLMPRAEVHALGSTSPHQSARWKHLNALIDRGMVSWPGNSRARRLKTWQRFSQQMTDALKKYQGPNMLVEAPSEADAHDDYCDSLALACALTIEVTMPEIQVDANPFYGR